MHDFREIGRRLSNWGRWGDDDERGTVNLITPEKIVAASQLVKRGAIFDLGIPFDAQGPAARRRADQPGPPDERDRSAPGVPRRVPLRRRLRVHAAAVGIAVGRPVARVLRRPDVQRLPVQRRRPVRREALLDRQARQGHRRSRRAARHRPPEGRRLARGRHGHHARRPRRGSRSARASPSAAATSCCSAPAGAPSSSASRTPTEFMAGEPGLGLDCCQWIADHEIAVVASDNWAIEVLPGEVETELLAGAHGAHPRHGRDAGRDPRPRRAGRRLRSRRRLGVLAHGARRSSSPHAVGSPINPLAIK